MLPSSTLLSITPWVSAVLLSSVGVFLLLALAKYRPHACPLRRTVALAALSAPLFAVVLWVKTEALLQRYPAVDIAQLIWTLSSLGAVLTLLVSRLLDEALQAPPISPRSK